MKLASMFLGGGVVVAAMILAAFSLSDWNVRRLTERVNTLEREKQQLMDYAQRLSATRRVAQVEVLRQEPDERGRTVTTLLWQEIGPKGTLGKPQVVDALGRQIYFEALVIKFQTALVGEGDPSRGHSLAMFRRVYGDQQAPESAPDIDRASRPPLDDPRDSDALHDRLWALFWKMTEDPAVAAQYGVRVAQSEAPSVRVEPGQFWQVSLDASGGLNLSRLMSRAAP